jgi:pimeloyl-ACP methyl ester carboxylesterase
MTLRPEGLLTVGAAQLEYRMIGPPPSEAPTLVLLHEGLGCVGLWDDFPDRLAAATGAGVFVYSRAGYGKSSPVPLPRPLSYMHDEALQVLPRLLEAIGFQRGILVGHSDGASIATIYAGSVQDHRIRGLALLAPHVFVEDGMLRTIGAAREAYETGDLKPRLARWHEHTDVAFYGWNRAWLDPAFRSWNITEALAFIRVPMLTVRGDRDQYSSPRHVAAIVEECYCPVETVRLPEAMHAPHREAADATLEAVAGFVNRLLRDHGEANPAADAA